jgi:hypothetical protein
LCRLGFALPDTGSVELVSDEPSWGRSAVARNDAKESGPVTDEHPSGVEPGRAARATCPARSCRRIPRGVMWRPGDAFASGCLDRNETSLRPPHPNRMIELSPIQYRSGLQSATRCRYDRILTGLWERSERIRIICQIRDWGRECSSKPRSAGSHRLADETVPRLVQSSRSDAACVRRSRAIGATV